MNTFTPNLQAYGCIWLQALAHLGWVAVSDMCSQSGGCLPNFGSANVYETVVIRARVCNLCLAKHDNINRHPFLIEISGPLCIPALLTLFSYDCQDKLDLQKHVQRSIIIK